MCLHASRPRRLFRLRRAPSLGLPSLGLASRLALRLPRLALCRRLGSLLLQRDTYAAQALELVERGGGVARTWELAAESAQNAANLLQILPASAARDALVVLCHKVLNAADPHDPRS